jgi:hypothetical protein
MSDEERSALAKKAAGSRSKTMLGQLLFLVLETWFMSWLGGKVAADDFGSAIVSRSS